jgi:pyruvate dehydrogenase E2 component (dihydrolipoamide acetyltransferase)
MAKELVMPRLSDTMESGTIGKWHKKVGDQIKRGEVVAEIETDTPNMDMEAFSDGIMARILVGEGETAALGQIIAIVAKDAAEAEKLQSEGDTSAGNGASAPQSAIATPQAATPISEETPNQAPAETAAPPELSAGAEPQGSPQSASNGRVKASPLARRVAQEHGLDLARISGTGPGGRITRDDVESFRKQGGAAAQPAEQPQAVATYTPPQPLETGAPPAPGRDPRPVEMTRMQQTIARRMSEARFTKPEFVLTVDVDMTEARALLQSLKSVEGAPKVGPNDLLIKASALALAQHPEVNAGWENNSIVRYGNVNIANAVAIPGGLVAPVIRNADRKGLGQVAHDSKDLTQRALNGKLAPNEYEDGTFTISNLGMYGIEQFTPIINAPAAAIMGVGTMEPRPVVIDGEIVVRQRMKLSVAFDHRIVNGAEGAQFLQTLVRLLEHPVLALL